MKPAPGDEYGIASGLLRTFANVGMVFSFAMAVPIASRRAAFAIFVGSISLPVSARAAFTSGLHAAFYPSTALMVLAGLLSATRAAPLTPGRRGRIRAQRAPAPASADGEAKPVGRGCSVSASRSTSSA
jgi:hypothetical protein